MRREPLSVFADWSFCLALVAAGHWAMILCLLLGMWSSRRLVGDEAWPACIPLLGVGAALAALLWWRVSIIRRVNREGVEVEAEVTRVLRGRGNAVADVHVKYPYEGGEVRSRFTWWSSGPDPFTGGTLSVVIDPRKPSRCYVRRRTPVRRAGSPAAIPSRSESEGVP